MATLAVNQPEQLDRDEVLLRYRGLVERIAYRVASTYGTPVGVDVDDLVSDGLIGLVEACERYDGTRGVAFESFAIPRVRGAIVDSIRRSDWVPRKVRARARRRAEATALLIGQLGRAPTDYEVADQLGETTKRSRSFPVTLLALDTTASRDAGDGGMSVMETLADEAAEEPGIAIVDAELRRSLVEALNRLADRDRLILTLYYFEGVQLADIAAALGVTESRVSQLHVRALTRLREGLESDQSA